MDWLRAVTALREERRAGVLVTVTAVRGHAPRRPGAKMVVAADHAWGTVGGGNLEATATARSRELVEVMGRGGACEPETITLALSDRARGDHARHGAQCCGGEVSLLLEPLPVVPAVAVFGLGHVGLELVDSRQDQTSPRRLAVLDDARARVSVHRVGTAAGPVLPETVVADLPAGAHVLVMTHDHGEDAALCDAALRRSDLGPIGLIGSPTKTARFRARLAEVGHHADALDRITTPIGLPGLVGEPAVIAVGVAAALLTGLGQQTTRSGSSPGLRRVEPSG